MVDGLVMEVLVVGTGELACAGPSLSVNFTGWLANCQIFDTTANREGPLLFSLGQGYVIRGWDEGVPGMRVGGIRRLTVAPELAYGVLETGEVSLSGNADALANDSCVYATYLGGAGASTEKK